MDDAGDGLGGGRLEIGVLGERWLLAFGERCLGGVLGVDVGWNGQFEVCHPGVEPADVVQEYADVVGEGAAAGGGEQGLEGVCERLLGVLAEGDVAAVVVREEEELGEVG